MSINDVSRVLDRWKISLIAYRSIGSYVNGRWTESSSQTLNFEGVVQNATPRDLLALPEGDRTDETIKIHTKYDLIPQQGDSKRGDVVVYEGCNWKVYNVAYRRIGNYNKVLAVKI